ncbi:MAG: carbon-nitrogen hydrolase family protein [Bacteroidetes bacterium]|nr:carbon-nitrogen hydrolase family protein [Bacteroidota bacterium]MCY4205768.1 carbon-nitrogen hydrolase family protein [Bacteroidota bacterium]
MKLAIIQCSATSDLHMNLARGLESLEMAAQSGADLIVYPELAFTPFYPQHRKNCYAECQGSNLPPLSLAEEVPGPTTKLFCEAAKRLGVVVVLNLYAREGENAYDASPVIDADGTILGVTRMMHITQYEGFYEQDYYTAAGNHAPVYHTSAGRIGVAICYDRHYPEYLRALALQKADLVVVPQAGALNEWPEGLFEAELRVGAFQNGYYMALANRVGREDVLTFGGGSFVVDPEGNVIDRAPEMEPFILYADLDFQRCTESHARRLFLRDRRPEIYSGGSVKI